MTAKFWSSSAKIQNLGDGLWLPYSKLCSTPLASQFMSMVSMTTYPVDDFKLRQQLMKLSERNFRVECWTERISIKWQLHQVCQSLEVLLKHYSHNYGKCGTALRHRQNNSTTLLHYDNVCKSCMVFRYCNHNTITTPPSLSASWDIAETIQSQLQQVWHSLETPLNYFNDIVPLWQCTQVWHGL